MEYPERMQQDECTPVKIIFTVLIGGLNESLRQRMDCNTCQTNKTIIQNRTEKELQGSQKG
jgi:hypothetical protein